MRSGLGPVTPYDEIWDVLLQPFLLFFFFFALSVRAESCLKHHFHLHTQIQFSAEVIRHRLIWFDRPHYLFLHWCCKNEFGLHQSTKLPTKPQQEELMPTVDPWDFVFGLVTTLGIYTYVAILAIKFFLDMKNFFIDKQDSAAWVFWNLFSNFLHLS